LVEYLIRRKPRDGTRNSDTEQPHTAVVNRRTWGQHRINHYNIRCKCKLKTLLCTLHTGATRLYKLWTLQALNLHSEITPCGRLFYALYYVLPFRNACEIC